METKSLGITKSVPDRIYDHLKEKIITGEFHSGEKVPSESELVETLSVSRNSLREALTRLEHEGYLVRKRGIGTFVMQSRVDRVNAAIDKLYSTSKLIASQGKVPGTLDLTTSTIPADLIVAEKLEIDIGTPVSYIERKRTADEKIFCWDQSYFPFNPVLVDQEGVRSSESLMDYVEKNLGVRIDHAIAHLKPAISNQIISEKMEIPPNTLMYVVEQVHFIGDSVPLWYSRVWYPEEAISVKFIVTW